MRAEHNGEGAKARTEGASEGDVWGETPWPNWELIFTIWIALHESIGNPTNGVYQIIIKALKPYPLH